MWRRGCFTSRTRRSAAGSVSVGPTSQDGSDQSGQEAPGVDGHVENGEELLPLAALEYNDSKAQEILNRITLVSPAGTNECFHLLHYTNNGPIESNVIFFLALTL